MRWGRRARGTALLVGGVAAAVEARAAPGLYFGAGAGGGVAWVEAPALAGGARGGFAWDAHAGWHVTPAVAAGFIFETWSPSLLLEPVHLHTIGPRGELHAGARDGPFVGLALGLALTENFFDGGTRPGLAVGPDLGWRRPLGEWTSIGVRASFRTQWYADGSALYQVLVLEAQAHGAQR